ncbi:hypothetical protein [Burkholderia ubonensis]|uniref:hypothetical protein n=1 Tax=Burkholderia ubonensis TaxID=101571 RepID=UPI00075ADC01|nr:hypothetical protein [Burkholderia ubonensis]
MDDIKDGGPAFPGEPDTWTPEGHQTQFAGMTLRDWFAGKAMQAFCEGAEGFGVATNDFIREQFDFVSRCAYLMADSMIRAREK